MHLQSASNGATSAAQNRAARHHHPATQIPRPSSQPPPQEQEQNITRLYKTTVQQEYVFQLSLQRPTEKQPQWQQTCEADQHLCQQVNVVVSRKPASASTYSPIDHRIHQYSPFFSEECVFHLLKHDLLVWRTENQELLPRRLERSQVHCCVTYMSNMVHSEISRDQQTFQHLLCHLHLCQQFSCRKVWTHRHQSILNWTKLNQLHGKHKLIDLKVLSSTISDLKQGCIIRHF